MHLYAFISDAIHGVLPGLVKPVAKEPAAAQHKPGYQNTMNIYNLQVAKAVYEHTMETLITITQRELLSLALEMYAQVANATIQKQVPHNLVTLTMVKETSSPKIPKQVWFELVPQATIKEVLDEDDQTVYMPNAYAVTIWVLLPNTTIIVDPFKTYL